MKKILPALFLIAVFLILPRSTDATLSGCSASVDPASINANSSASLGFSIQNDDASNLMVWARITTPSSSYVITNYTSTGNSVNFSESEAVITGFNTLPGSAIGQSLIVASGAEEGLSNWIVQASDDSGGDGAINCSGNLGTSIVTPPSENVITNLTISNITSTSVTISWTTSSDSDSYVDYGITSEYGSSVNDSTFVTSHSLGITGLSANTTYHFNVTSSGVYSGDQTFTTAAPGLTGQTVTLTVTNTTTKLITPTPTPTPLPDTTKPTVSITTEFSLPGGQAKPFLVPPEIKGKASDNKSVSKVEYSLDGGKNWFPVDNIVSPGKTSTAFSFTPPVLDDGNYAIRVRATDSAGNSGQTAASILVIDRLPPQVSGVLFSLGPQILNPAGSGGILVSQSKDFKITLSDVGGSTSIDIFADPLNNLSPASSGSGPKKFRLIKNPDSGLWSANLNIDKEGEYQLRVLAVDGAGNKTERNLNKVRVVNRGKINAGEAIITVYFQDKNTNAWKEWDGSSYGQENPIKSDQSGGYSLFLPTGKYYLQVKKYGYQNQTTQIFSISKPQPINADFSLKPSRVLIDLKFIKLYWPDFSELSVAFKNNLPQEALGGNDLVGQQLPFFAIDGFQSDKLNGKPAILTFLNTWSPTSGEQIAVLNKFSQNKNFNSATIIEGEKSSKVSIYKKRGSYSLPMYTDPDATLITAYRLSALPTSYFIDRKGIITGVFSGVLSEKEILNILSK